MQTRKSGTNLQNVLTGETYDGTYVGTVEVATDQVPLTFDLPETPRPDVDDGVVSVPCWQVLVQADSGNTANVAVGNEAHGCHIVLTAGSSITIPINDVKKIYARAVSGTQNVNWIAMI